MILRAFLFAFTRDHDVIDDGIAGLQHTEDRLPIAGESIKTAVSLLDSMIARKIDLQKMVHTPDPSYAGKLASCETEVEELRRLITLREQGNSNAASL